MAELESKWILERSRASPAHYRSRVAAIFLSSSSPSHMLAAFDEAQKQNDKTLFIN